MSEPEPMPDGSALARFLAAKRKDEERGVLRSLAEYLRAFPGDDVGIALVYVEAAEAARPTTAEQAAAGENDWRIGGYRILDEIGSGGQGTVYRAYDERVDRIVALKVLSAVGALSPRTLERFRREAAATARLDHPNICSVFDAGFDDATAYIAMRWVEGETLARLIRGDRREPSRSTRSVVSAARGEGSVAGEISSDIVPSSVDGRKADGTTSSTPRTREDLSVAASLIEKIARALHAAHEAGVVHRDLNPKNIMITPNGEPVIVDFGLARIANDDVDLTSMGDLLGTPAYMAPEQIESAIGGIDRRTDVWALGVTLFEILTLARPFDAPTREGLYRAILHDEPPSSRALNPSIPPDLETIVAACLQKNRDRRYRTAADLADDLSLWRDHRPIRARSPGATERLGLWCRRNPLISTLLAALFVTMGTGIFWTSRQNARLMAQNREIVEWIGRARKADADRSMSLGLAAGTASRLVREYEEDLWPLRRETLPRIAVWESMAAKTLESRRYYAESGAAEKLAAFTSDRPSPEMIAATRSLASEIVGDLDRLEVAVKAVRERHAEIERLHRIVMIDNASAWRECLSDLGRDERLSAKISTPRAGLVPLRKNRRTGLWEFWNVESGDRPELDPQTDEFDIRDGTGIVLVLLPGGDFLKGAQDDDPDAPAYDENAHAADGPTHRVRLAPFFLSKYETTQSQWLRLMGDEPSYFRPSAAFDGAPRISPRALPVESVSWFECRRFCKRLGFDLPTDAQWEFAYRGATTTVFPFGDSPVDLEQYAWILPTVRPHKEPRCVGRRAPELNGFFDLSGNVAEWCLDRAPYAPVRIDRPLMIDPCIQVDVVTAIVRGGAWSSMNSAYSKSAFRDAHDAGARMNYIGFRVARPID